MTEPGNPTLRRRELGHRLRELRLAAGLTLDQVAGRVHCSLAKASRIETGSRGVAAADLRALLELYDVPPDERARLLALARQSKERGWWQAYDVSYATYIGLESSARSISEYNPSVIPGLLQTREYAVALAEGAGMSRPEATRLADVRMTRQRLLAAEHAPELAVVIDEAALRLRVGAGGIMRRQLGVLMKIASSRLPMINLQVLPFAAGPHPSLNSNFVILGFDGEISDVVYVEGLHGFFYLEKGPDIARYRAVFGQLRDKALRPDDSVGVISELLAHHPEEPEQP